MRDVFVHATFSAVALEEGIRWWIRQLWPEARLCVGGHDTLFQCVFDPDSHGLKNAEGTLILALDPLSIDRLEGESLSREKFRQALEHLAGRPGLQVVLAVLHASGTASNTVAPDLAGIPGILIIEAKHIEPFLSGPVLAPAATARAAGIPYTRQYCAALSTAIARRLDQLERPQKKVLVLDCDNTLWAGVVAEDGVTGLKIENRHRRLAHIAGMLRKAGWLICLCSKNEPEDVRAALDTLNSESSSAGASGLGLAWNDLAATRVNWDDKASNLRSLAGELNLGLESFVFVDDNPVECAGVNAALPEVSVLHVDPATDNQWLERVWLFESGDANSQTTREDEQRTIFYARNSEREALRESLGSARDFLDALKIEMSVDHALAADSGRIAQLSLRTNQFNFSGIKLGEHDVSALLENEGALVIKAHLRDRFGDYGLVGAAIAAWRKNSLIIDGFWLSCRALGRGVEHEMVRALGAAATEAGCQTLAFALSKLPRNLPARRFAQVLDPAAAVGEQVEMTASAAGKLRFDPEKQSVPESKPTESPITEASGALPRVQASGDYALFARCASGSELLRVIEEGVAARPDTGRAYAMPRSDLERILAQVWAETLSLDRVGIHDEFEELGGRSIQLVTIHARIRERLGCELEFVDLFRFTSVSALAAHLEGHSSGRMMDDVAGRAARQRRARSGFHQIDRGGFRV